MFAIIFSHITALPSNDKFSSDFEFSSQRVKYTTFLNVNQFFKKIIQLTTIQRDKFHHCKSIFIKVINFHHNNIALC